MNTSQTTQNADAGKRSASELVLAFFTSPLFMMLALGLALLAQGKHTADVFAFWSHKGTPDWLFYAFAGGVEIAVFIFVLHDHKRTSYAFAVGAFATNVVYYAIGGANLLSAELAPVLLLSVLLPGVIVGYSHTIAEKPKTDAIPPAKAPAKTIARPWWRRLMFWRKPTETPATNIGPKKAPAAPVALPAGTLTPSGATPSPAAQTGETSAQPQASQEPDPSPDLPTVPAKAQALHLHSEGYSPAEIARMTGAKYSTVQSWLRRATVQTNGATHL